MRTRVRWSTAAAGAVLIPLSVIAGARALRAHFSRAFTLQLCQLDAEGRPLRVNLALNWSMARDETLPKEVRQSAEFSFMAAFRVHWQLLKQHEIGAIDHEFLDTVPSSFARTAVEQLGGLRSEDVAGPLAEVWRQAFREVGVPAPGAAANAAEWFQRRYGCPPSRLPAWPDSSTETLRRKGEEYDRRRRELAPQIIGQRERIG